MKTLQLTVAVPEEAQELLVAELADLGFDAFEQRADALAACMPARRWTPQTGDAVAAWLRDHGYDDRLDVRAVRTENWNRRWERTIAPLAVGAFVIRPSWAAVPAAYRDRVVLTIDPKMTFGTGYHASTRLVLQLLPDALTPGDRVLDAGTGTGILTVAAVKLGGAAAIAFDVDPWTADNAAENFARNDVSDRVDLRIDDLSNVPETGFDLILANINLNVLTEMMPAFARRCVPDGRLILSGLLLEDRAPITEVARAAAFTLAAEATEHAWWAGCFRKEDA